jgi:hypothetical protein
VAKANDHAVQPCPLRARSEGQLRCFRGTHGDWRTCPDLGHSRSEECEPQPSKLVMRVRFPSPALIFAGQSAFRRLTDPSAAPVPHMCHTRPSSRVPLFSRLWLVSGAGGLANEPPSTSAVALSRPRVACWQFIATRRPGQVHARRCPGVTRRPTHLGAFSRSRQFLPSRSVVGRRWSSDATA